MKLTHTLLCFLLILTFNSCNQAPAKQKAKANIAPPVVAVKQMEKVPVPPLSQLTAEDTSFTLNFQEFTINLNRFIPFEDDKEVYKHLLENDTVEILAELGETIEGQKITVTSEVLTNIRVEQRYETSVTIMDEGPHCDLTAWKHYTSEWVNLPAKGEGVFTGQVYTDQDSDKFPAVSINELKTAVKKECGEEWVKHIRNVKSVRDYPSGVGISRIFLRVTGKRKDTGVTIQKKLLIEVPMGC